MSGKNLSKIEGDGVDITKYVDGVNAVAVSLSAAFRPHAEAIASLAQELGVAWMSRERDFLRALERIRGSFVVDSHKPKIQHQMQRRRERKARRRNVARSN